MRKEGEEEGGREGGREGAKEGGWGLLASCRLNKRRVKEMEREAICRVLFFMGCNRKGLNKREQETDQRGKIYDRSQDSRSQSPSPLQRPLA